MIRPRAAEVGSAVVRNEIDGPSKVCNRCAMLAQLLRRYSAQTKTLAQELGASIDVFYGCRKILDRLLPAMLKVTQLAPLQVRFEIVGIKLESSIHILGCRID